tara:strand:+ start:669 stop:1226 length:558 start_codon:yes stop_codon:yes gene_type:complete
MVAMAVNNKKLSKTIQEDLLLIGEDIIIDLGVTLVLKRRIQDKTKSRLITEAEPKIDGTKLQIYMPDYWVYVNYGTSAGDVPYTPRKAGEPAKGGSSKYISALYNYLITKGFNSSDPRTKGIAFAIANKQKKYGNPIDRSKLGFLEKSIRDNQDKWISAIEEALGQALEVAIFEEFDRANKQIKI